MALNLNFLWDILKQLFGAPSTNNNSQKQESSAVNQNGNYNNSQRQENTVGNQIGNNNNSIVGNGNNNNIIISSNYYINGEKTIISETNETALIKNIVWPAIDQDIRIQFGSTDSLWLHKGRKDGKKYIDIGIFYSCKLKDTEKIFWLGVEANEAGENRVYLFINAGQVKQAGQEQKCVCEVLPDENGAYVIPIDEFSPDAGQEALEAALREKLQKFLQDIFKDT